MEKDILSKVIGVEKEIHEKVDTENRKSKEWIDATKREIEAEVAREEEILKGSFIKAEENAVADARSEAVKVIENATQRAGRIAEISDETLRSVVMKYITGILPK